MSCKLQQNLIFFMLIFCSFSTKIITLPECKNSWRADQENNSKDKKTTDEEQLLIDLSTITSDFYKKLIETTMLYFTGILKNSDQYHKQLLFESSKHALYASQIVTQYVSKILKDPNISWKRKLKCCTYLSSFLIFMIICISEFHNPANHPVNTSTNYVSSPYPPFQHFENNPNWQSHRKQNLF